MDTLWIYMCLMSFHAMEISKPFGADPGWYRLCNAIAAFASEPYHHLLN